MDDIREKSKQQRYKCIIRAAKGKKINLYYIFIITYRGGGGKGAATSWWGLLVGF